MSLEYTLYDHFDREMNNAVKKKFKDTLSVGQEFTIDDVSYRVTQTSPPNAKELMAIIRMTKYRIPNTATQFMHFCPAKKKRLKMQGHMAIRCPNCEVTFWKESMDFPETVEVPKTFGRKKLIKRRRPNDSA